MGADLILAWCQMPQDANGMVPMVDALPELEARIEAVTDDRLEAALYALTGESVPDDDEEFAETMGADWRTYARERLKEALDVFNDDRRDACVVKMPTDGFWMFAGGTSYGSFNDVLALAESGITEAPLRIHYTLGQR